MMIETLDTFLKARSVLKKSDGKDVAKSERNVERYKTRKCRNIET